MPLALDAERLAALAIAVFALTLLGGLALGELVPEAEAAATAFAGVLIVFYGLAAVVFVVLDRRPGRAERPNPDRE